MLTLHQCINYVLAPLAKCALNCLQCKINDGRMFLLHCMLASCVAGNPKAKDLLSVKRGNCTATACHVREVGAEDLARQSDAPKRC